MNRIHPTAIVEGARLGDGVEIGPYAVVEAGAEIGDGTVVGPHAVVRKWAKIGRECRIGAGALIGGDPQSFRFDPATETFVRIGDGVFIGEYCVIHRATEEGQATEIGDRAFIMGQSHIGHDCRIASHVTMTTFAGLAGHVVVDEGAVIGAFAGVHQFCRIGRLAMVAAQSKIGQDIVPFVVAQGWPAKPVGVNMVGMKRAGIPESERLLIRRAFKLLFRSGLDTSSALKEIEALGDSTELKRMVDFVRSGRRGIAK
ncbi:MAG TPA: acyl-ACP--UDP-N-acetylglucosamine O-acyltransferase [Proteobacteria bacterium]|nr:acyl-ACP--UDP-N-acetylglucosamine O-acyltransferase [Pseudomonadota bacterium]